VIAVHPLYSKAMVLQQSFCAEKQSSSNPWWWFSACLLWSLQSFSAEVREGSIVMEQEGLFSEITLMH